MGENEPATRGPDDVRRPWQFRLKHLLWFTAWFAGLCATATWLGAIAALFYLAVSAVVSDFFNWRTRPLESAVGVVILLSLGFAVLMLSLPRDSGGANARGQCQNNLMAIAFALKGYHAQHGSFPPAYIADKNGKPLHSWRVLLLPYLERADVLRQYRFDEPWDGPNNRYLAVNRPRVYACPADPQQRQRSAATSYLAVVGPGVAWTGKKPVKLSDIRDNPHSTILVVEVINSEIHWMEPRDLDVEMMAKQVNFKTLRSISSGHGNGAFVAMADGSVRFLDNETTCAVLDALLTRAGGESLEDDASIP